jgi:nitroreductase
MELTDAVRRRRMVRSYSGRPVPRSVLEGLLDNALRSPSAGNTGGWDAVVLQGPSETAVFWQATTTPEWRARSRRWAGLEPAPAAVVLFAHPRAYVERYAEPDKESSGLGRTGAPADGSGGDVAGAAPADGSGGDVAGAAPAATPWPVPYWFVDTAFAALTLLLGAVDAGLGACFLGNFRGEAELRAALGVPGDRRYVGTVLVGEPAGEDPPSASLARGRRRADEVVHWRRW